MVKAPMAETVVPPQRAVMAPVMSAVMTQMQGGAEVAAVVTAVTAISGTGQCRLGGDRQDCGAYTQGTPQEAGGVCHGRRSFFAPQPAGASAVCVKAQRPISGGGSYSPPRTRASVGPEGLTERYKELRPEAATERSKLFSRL